MTIGDSASSDQQEQMEEVKRQGRQPGNNAEAGDSASEAKSADVSPPQKVGDLPPPPGFPPESPKRSTSEIEERLRRNRSRMMGIMKNLKQAADDHSDD